MTPSLFSQSLFALSLSEAIEATAQIGLGAIELACKEPHFGRDALTAGPQPVIEQLQKAGLVVSALSLFNSFTDGRSLEQEIDQAVGYIRLAPLFGTRVVKLTPGSPASVDATEEHWRCLEHALRQLVPIARDSGVRLAFETHMRQLTDTLAGSMRLLEIAPSDAVGFTLDFSNMAFAGEKIPEVFAALSGRIYNTHLKNGTLGEDGSWHFCALDEGLTDYAEVIPLLRQANYAGYLTIECLGADAQKHPIETAQRDLKILQRHLGDALRFRISDCGFQISIPKFQILE